MTDALTAIVPMRGGSERIPGKNLRLLHGQPLYAHIVSSLQQASSVASVVVDTDSEEIAQDVRERFPLVTIVIRPRELGHGSTSMNRVLEHTLSQVEEEHFIQVHSTSPFLKASTIDRAWSTLNRVDDYDSAFGVTRWQARLWTASGQPLNHDLNVLLPTQELDPVFLENSSLYIFSRDSFQQAGARIGLRPMMVEVDFPEALDIDEERDFALAQALMTVDSGGGA